MVNILLQISAVPQISDPSNFTAAYESLVPGWIAAVYPYAGELFSALAFLDLAVFGWTLIRRHGNNIQGAILSTTNRLVLIGAFLALLMNGSSWMGAIINMFIQVGKAGSGVAAIQPSVVLQQGINIIFALLGQSALSGILMSPVTAIAMVAAALAIGISFVIIVAEFVITKIQTFLVLGMGFFFLAFGGSSWTRTYVERYFAYAFSSGIKLMALYFLIGTGQAVSSVWLQQAQNAPWSLAGVEQAWIIMFGAIIFGAICWRCPAMAAQLLGGGPNLTHGEVFQSMGTAVQAGVATALVASGAGTVAGAAMAGGSATSSGAAAAKATAGSASGGSTPASKPPSANRNGSKGPSAYQSASAAAGVFHSAGSGGNHQVHVPAFKGLAVVTIREENELQTVVIAEPLRDADPQQIKEAVNEKARRFKREWEERYSSLLTGRRHWKIMAGAQTVVIGGLCVALWDMGRQAHTPDVVVLERSGSQISYAAVQPQNMDDATWNLVRVEQLKRFLSYWRTVTSDEVAQNADWDMAFAFVGDNSQARQALDEWYKANDPLKRAAKGELVTVQFKTFDPPLNGSHTYGLWWTETTTSSSGQVMGTKTWHARIVYTQKIPTSEYAKQINGLGILATELSFEPVAGS